MALTEMLDIVPEMENGMVPIFKDGSRTAIPLRKYFHDISVYLSTNMIDKLLLMGNGIHIKNGKNGISFHLDFGILKKMFEITKDESGNLYQANKRIPIPKSEMIINGPIERIRAPKPDDDKISQLETALIKQGNQIMSKEEIKDYIKELVKSGEINIS